MFRQKTERIFMCTICLQRKVGLEAIIAIANCVEKIA